MTKHKPSTDEDWHYSGREFSWNDDGESEANHLLLPPVEAILRQNAAKSVFDLGCGSGHLTNQLSKKGFYVIGCDASQSGLAVAKKNFPSLHLFQHDINEDPPREYHSEFDAVISLEVIEHLFFPRRLFENALLILKPGGVLILSTPFHGYWKNLALAITDSFDRHWHPLRDFGHIKFFSKATLSALFDEFNFEKISFQTVGRIPMFAKSMIAFGFKKGA